MIRQTGGVAFGATSTRSMLFARAILIASCKGRMPTWAPSGPITLTSRARILPLILTAGAREDEWERSGRLKAPSSNEGGSYLFGQLHVLPSDSHYVAKYMASAGEVCKSNVQFAVMKLGKPRFPWCWEQPMKSGKRPLVPDWIPPIYARRGD